MGIQKQGWVTCMLTLHGARLLPETPVPPAAHPEGLGAQPGHRSPQYDPLCTWLSNQKPLQIPRYQSSDLPLQGDKEGS